MEQVHAQQCLSFLNLFSPVVPAFCLAFTNIKSYTHFHSLSGSSNAVTSTVSLKRKPLAWNSATLVVDARVGWLPAVIYYTR
jgi:hypothetical protein